MKINQIQMKGFRSISDITIDLARINVLAGKNNSGKSNLLQSLELFSNVRENCSRMSEEDFNPTHKTIECNCHAQLTYGDIAKIKTILKGKQLVHKNIVDFNSYAYSGIQFFITIEKSNYNKPDEILYYLAYKKSIKYYPLFGKTVSDSIANDILTTFREMLKNHVLFIKLKDSFSTIEQSNHNKIAKKILSQFGSGDPSERKKYNLLRDYLFYVTEGIGGELQPAMFEDKVEPYKYRMRHEVEKKYLLPISYSGDGAQRVAYILYHLINSSYEIIVIEEPEVCLHPGAQKRFRKILDELCDIYQKRLLISTHSPFFLEGWKTANVYKIENLKGISQVEPVVKRDQYISIATGLGINPSDAFVADGIIWVEGPSDVVIYKIFFDKLGLDLDAKNIAIMFFGGDALQHIEAKDLQRLNRNFVVILDSDKKDSKHAPAKWKKDIVENSKKIGCYGFITERKEVENYFSLRAIRTYYRNRNLPQLDCYADFKVYVLNNIQGRSYSKMKDAVGLASCMSKDDIENSGDLYNALREIQSCIMKWKGV